MKREGERKLKQRFESLDILLERWHDGTFGEIIDDWKWILRYGKSYRRKIFLYVILGILSTTFGVVSSVAGKYLIDSITGYQLEKVVMLILIVFSGSICSLIITSLLNHLSARLCLDIHNDIQADVFEKIVDADWLALQQYANGDILNRFNEDIKTISVNAVKWIPTVIVTGYHFVITFLVLIYYDVIMAVIALLGAPFLFFSSRYFIRRQKEYGRRVREVNSELMAFETETFYNMDTIKSFGAASHYSNKMRKWQAKWKHISLKYNMFSIKTNIWLSLVGETVQYVAFGYCLFRLWTRDITYGTMTLFLHQRMKLSSAFNGMVGVIPNFLNGAVAARRVRELVDLPKEVHVWESKELDEHVKDGFVIDMKDVEFSYKEGEKVILSSHFRTHPGEIVGVTGPSGEGKTTLIRLLLGLIRPETGKVIIRASSGCEIPTNVETRCLFAYVPQGNTLLSGTIVENMRMAKEDATEEEIIDALKVACAWEFVEKLPEGIHSILGERGKGLSEGQAQRISIARAILRDAPILLLDEATSALDAKTEQRVLENIMKQRPNKTCIVATHRESVFSMCQRVYRVVEARITELDETVMME